jgi:nucleotide-binding universal stress UspA family protein
MYDRIFLPTDGSDRTSVVEHALNVPELSGGALYALSVVDDRELPGSDREAILASSEQAGTEATERVAELTTERAIEVAGAVRRGTPHETILECAEEHDIDPITRETRLAKTD